MQTPAATEGSLAPAGVPHRAMKTPENNIWHRKAKPYTMMRAYDIVALSSPRKDTPAMACIVHAMLHI